MAKKRNRPQPQPQPQPLEQQVKDFPHLVETLSDADRCPGSYRRVFGLTPTAELILRDLP